MLYKNNSQELLNSFETPVKAVVIGASGSIGRAIVDILLDHSSVTAVLGTSRNYPAVRHHKFSWVPMDLEDEESISCAAKTTSMQMKSVTLVILASGILHDKHFLKPEKSWTAIDRTNLLKIFSVNTIGPLLVAKYFLPLLSKDSKSVLAALTARVGSIQDNYLGGWYGYRASKTALNMAIKTLAIELVRRNPKALCVAIHPGTVDTPLSKPYQRPETKLFKPSKSAMNIIGVLNQLSTANTGNVYAWDGGRIPA